MADTRTPPQADSSVPLFEEIDRTHCPSDEAVKAVACPGATVSEEMQEHIAQCPACRREFQDHRVQWEWERFYQKSKWLLYAIMLIILGSIIFRASKDGFSW